jgi:hypothetical protein
MLCWGAVRCHRAGGSIVSTLTPPCLLPVVTASHTPHTRTRTLTLHLTLHPPSHTPTSHPQPQELKATLAVVQANRSLPPDTSADMQAAIFEALATLEVGGA